MNMKIRIVNLDFYMSAPIPSLDVIYSEFRGCSVNQVPVIRIFGSTEAGHKICLHVHGVFPYIYIPYDSQAPAEGFLYQIASGLDKAINLSLGQASSNVQHIYKVCLVSGIPLYGYHAREHQFLKLYFYNPFIIKKACMLLQNGSILGKIYQPNEAHIPYILQFMIDYNLHGMSFIHLKNMKYRVDPNSSNEHSEDSILPITISKMSTCKVEGDTQADCILNREEIASGKLTINPGIKAIWDDEKQRRRNNDESSQIDHCLTQNRVNIPQTATHIAYMNVLEDKLRKRPKHERSSSLELSVYPAETPPTADVLNASTVETHTSNSQNTDNSSLDETITPDLNTTDFDESLLNEEAQKLYDVLQDLRQDNIEKDSILSQVQRDVESEEEGDLSLPLNALQTPRKIDEPINQTGNEFWNDSYFDVLAHVPQLDGSCDVITSKERKHKKKEVIDNSKSEVTRGKSDDNMQLFEKDSIVKNNGGKRKDKNREIKKKRSIWKINTNSLFKKSKGKRSCSPTKLHTKDISPYFVKADDIAKKSTFLNTSEVCSDSLKSYSKSSSNNNIRRVKRTSRTSKNPNQSPKRQKSPAKFGVKEPAFNYFETHNINKKLSFPDTNELNAITSGNSSFGLPKIDISKTNTYVVADKRNLELAEKVNQKNLIDHIQQFRKYSIVLNKDLQHKSFKNLGNVHESEHQQISESSSNNVLSNKRNLKHARKLREECKDKQPFVVVEDLFQRSNSLVANNDALNIGQSFKSSTKQKLKPCKTISQEQRDEKCLDGHENSASEESELKQNEHCHRISKTDIEKPYKEHSASLNNYFRKLTKEPKQLLKCEQQSPAFNENHVFHEFSMANNSFSNSINIRNEKPSLTSKALQLQGNAQKTYRSNTNIQDISKVSNVCENICHTSQKKDSTLTQNIKVPKNDKKLLVPNEDIQKFSGLKPTEVNSTENKIKNSSIVNDINESDSSKKFEVQSEICFVKLAKDTFDELSKTYLIKSKSKQSKKRLNKKNIKSENIQNVYKKVRNEKYTPIKQSRGKITKVSITEGDDDANGNKNKFLNMPLIDDTSSDQNIDNKSNIKIVQNQEMHFAKSFLSEGDISSLKDSNNNKNSNDYTIKNQHQNECLMETNTTYQDAEESFNKKMRENVSNGHISKQEDNENKGMVTEDTLTFKDSQNSVITLITHVTKNINSGQGFDHSKACSSGGKVQSSNIACSGKINERYTAYNNNSLRRNTSNELKLPLTKTNKKSVRIKTKRSTKKLIKRSTQTQVKRKRDKFKNNGLNLKHIEPAVNIIITSTGKTDEFQINICRKGDLGPNPRPRFRIVSAKRPYTFELKKTNNHKYRNTTWTCDKKIFSNSYAINKGSIRDKDENSMVIISNTLLEGSEKYNDACIEKEGRFVNFVPSRMIYEKSQKQNQEVSEILSVLDNTNNSTCLSRLNSQEMEVVESLNELFNEIQENLYDNQKNANKSMQTTKCETINLNSYKASEFLYNSDRILSYEDFDVEQYTDYGSNETKRSTSKDEIVREDEKKNYADMNNYRHEMKRAYEDVCEKLVKSFDNLFENIKLTNNYGTTSNKLLLDIIKEKSRKQRGGILVQHRIQRSNKKIRFREICNVRNYNFDSPCTYLDVLVDLNVNENSINKIPNDVKFQPYDPKKKKDNCRIIKNTTENVSADSNCFESVTPDKTKNFRNIFEVDIFNFAENMNNNNNKPKQTIKLKRSGYKSELEIKSCTMEQETFAGIQGNLSTDTVRRTNCLDINRMSKRGDDTGKKSDGLEIVSNSQSDKTKKLKEVSRNVSQTCMSPKSNEMKIFKNNINQRINTNKPREPTECQKLKHKMKRKDKLNTLDISPEQSPTGAELESNAVACETFDMAERNLPASTLDNKNCPNSFHSPKISNISLNRDKCQSNIRIKTLSNELMSQNINANIEDALNVAQTYIPNTNKTNIVEHKVVDWDNTNRSEKSLQLKKSVYKAKSKTKPMTMNREFPEKLAESTVVNENSSSMIQVSDVNKLISAGSLQDANKRSKRKKQLTEEENLSSIQHFAVNQYRYLDGPNDSSSEDEDSVRPVVKKKCRQFKKTLSESAKYSPLNVQYGSPTKKFEKTGNNSNLQNPIYRPSISLTTEDLNNSTTEKNPQNIQECLQKHRRKLNFSEMSSQNRTVVEENLMCNYKLDKKLLESIETVSTASSEELPRSQYDQASISTCTSSENMDETSKFPNISVCSTIQEDVEALNRNVHIANGDQVACKQGIVGPLNSNIVNNSENCCEQLNISQEIKKSKTENNDNINIISSGSESNDIFFPDYLHDSFSSVFSFDGTTIKGMGNLNKYAAELYDVRNNFVPQAGSSKFNKILSQSSVESTDIKTPLKLSLESSDTNVSSSAENQSDVKSFTSNISDKSHMNVITPYQKEIPSKLSENTSLYEIETDHLDISSNENDNENSVCQITPHQDSTVQSDQRSSLTSYLTICDSFVRSTLVKGECCLIVPKYNPPQRSLIESTFSEYNIPEVQHQQPFYSDVNDVTGAVEVGARILKIPSNNIIDIPEFESNYVGLTHYRRLTLEEMYPNEKITNKGINNYKLSFCKDTEHLITTVRLPPSRDEVESWLKDRAIKKHKTIKAPEKKKIFIPCSPGGEDHESDDSLTISPCTPLDVTLTNIEPNDGENETLKSSSEDRDTNTSPIIKKNEVLKRHRKRLMENSPLNLLKGNNVCNDSDSSINASKLNLSKNKKNDSYQITGVTLDRTNDFAMSSTNLQGAKAICEYLHLTVMCMELIVQTRSEHKPDPNHDNIKGIVYKIFNDVPEDHHTKRTMTGCLLVNSISTSSSKVNFSILDGISVSDYNIKVTDSEEDLLYQFTALVTECDPDILVGYEIETLSWGYLVERGYILNLNLVSLLSRITLVAKNKNEDNSDLTIPGRIILDFWRLLRHEMALQSYTFENIVYHVLHQRVPCYSFKNITYWWNNPSALYRAKVLKYYFFRVESVLKIMEQLDLIGRTSELAKLFGIQFFEVLSRGSQFRVESMMLRLAKPLNYIPVSPNVQQRANMRAPESLPLIMEPESKFYADPVIVLDFQSLYPSMIIAYNYCFSTCLGRIEHLGGDSQFEFGATQLKVSRKRIKSLHRKNLINISPVGVAYVKKSVREGILPRMLQEILDTRLMVKKSLKKNSGNKTLEKILDARQLGLKLIANVTYGYTAANFSGRMPCIEVGDSVVSKGRETLQRAITLVEKTSKWNAKVVYGDTDSLFVLVAGRSREDAFKIGAEIAEAVTNDNPSPVKLKLEKVFHPCILQTKKRYVGYMYESPEQEVPEYCAKGIETVRRDGCPAVSKMLEKCLKILFDTRNVSLVRQYVNRQFLKILSGRISIQDLTFAKEYRGSSNYRPGACVPALELARKWMATDKRSEPRRGERVPYVIINGPPGLPLIRLVRSPREVIADPSLRLNVLYYITKVIIPPINRCFLLIGADVNNWFNAMPRKQFQYLHTSSPVKGQKSTISQYFSTRNCAVCGQQSQEGLCETCLGKPQDTCVILHEKVRIFEKNHFETKTICESCCGTLDKINCISLDCPVYYRRIQTEKDIVQAPFIRQLVSLLPDLDF